MQTCPFFFIDLLKFLAHRPKMMAPILGSKTPNARNRSDSRGGTKLPSQGGNECLPWTEISHRTILHIFGNVEGAWM